MMSDYIRKLREKVGNMPIVLSVTSCLILNEQHQVLLQHRTDDNLWSNPGGAVELGESVEEAVKREVFEETGLKLQQIEFFNIYSGESQHHVYPNGDEVYFINVVYICRNYVGKPVSNDHESKEVKFWDLNDLPQMAPPTRRILEDLKLYLSESDKK